MEYATRGFSILCSTYVWVLCALCECVCCCLNMLHIMFAIGCEFTATGRRGNDDDATSDALWCLCRTARINNRVSVHDWEYVYVYVWVSYLYIQLVDVTTLGWMREVQKYYFSPFNFNPFLINPLVIRMEYVRTILSIFNMLPRFWSNLSSCCPDLGQRRPNRKFDTNNHKNQTSKLENSVRAFGF